MDSSFKEVFFYFYLSDLIIEVLGNALSTILFIHPAKAKVLYSTVISYLFYLLPRLKNEKQGILKSTSSHVTCPVPKEQARSRI